jgi:hypothetical protein
MNDNLVTPLSPRQLLELMTARLPGLSEFTRAFALPEQMPGSSAKPKDNPMIVRLADNLSALAGRARAGLDESAGEDIDIPVLFAGSGGREDMARGAFQTLSPVGARERLTGGPLDRTLVMRGRLDLVVNLAGGSALAGLLGDHAAALGHDTHPAFAAPGTAGALKDYAETMGRALEGLGAIYNANALINTNRDGGPSRPKPLNRPEHMFDAANVLLFRKIAKNPALDAVHVRLRAAFSASVAEGVRIFENAGRPAPALAAPGP